MEPVVKPRLEQQVYSVQMDNLQVLIALVLVRVLVQQDKFVRMRTTAFPAEFVVLWLLGWFVTMDDNQGQYVLQRLESLVQSDSHVKMGHAAD